MKVLFITISLLIISTCIHAQIQLGDTISEYTGSVSSFAGRVEMPDSRHISTLEKRAVPMQWYFNASPTLYNYHFNKNQQTWILQDTFSDIENFARPDSNTLVLWQSNNPTTLRVYDYTAGNWVQRGDDITIQLFSDYRFTSLEMKSDSVFTVSDGQSNKTYTYEWTGSAWTSWTPLLKGGNYHDTYGDSLLIVGHWANSEIKVYKKLFGIWNQYGSTIPSLSTLRSVSIGSDQTIAIAGAGTGRVFDLSNNVWTQRGADLTFSGAAHLGQEMQMIDANKIALIDPQFAEGGLFAIYNWNNGSSVWSPDAVIQGVHGLGHGFSMPNEDFLAIGSRTTEIGFSDYGRIANAIVTYSFCDAVNTSADITACEDFTWIDGNTYTSSNNSAQATLSTINGCDSVVTLNLTISNVDASVTSSPPSIEANAVAATYQWIDCATGLPIDSAFSKVFVAQTNGSYAVVVTQNGCTDTSLCYQINNVGLNNLATLSNIKVYPNPTNGKFTIDAENFEVVEVYDVSGRLILESKLKTIDLEGQSKGLYLLKINANGTTQEFKVLKE